MEVSFDSPEAFEEVIWLSHLKNKYVQPDRLVPLTLKNTSTSFADKISITLRKLILEASENGNSSDQQKRYISKNNANISRIPVLMRLFPSATILVPFREPLSHIGSLMKQHQLFTEMHKNDEFAKSYMRWLGHYDFGENFKPIDFDHWLDNYQGEINYGDENFWLQYWIACYTNILSIESERVHLVDYNKLLAEPELVLEKITEKVQLIDSTDFIKHAKSVRAPTSKAKDGSKLKPDIFNAANQLFDKLKKAAL